jgi:SagB-type dehydrogenase family enzyme
MSKLHQERRWLTRQHFLKFREGRAILWDYARHQQYEVGEPELQRLLQFSAGASLGDSDVDEAIVEAGVLDTLPSEERWGWDWLAELFHTGTNHPQEAGGTSDTTESYLEFCESIRKTAPQLEIIRGGARVSLPLPDHSLLQAASLWETLLRRRTCRDFDPRTLTLSQVATLIHAAFGATDRNDEEGGLRAEGYRRTSPAAGGLQVCEPYLWVRQVDGLAPGLYHYLSLQHELEIVREGLPDETLGQHLCNQNWADDLPCGVVITARFDKMWWKYPHSRAYRPMMIDVGHLSQTLTLCATAMGLKVWMTGYFHDKSLNRLLDLDEPNEHVVFFLGFGHGSGSAFSREMLQSQGRVAQ